MSGSIYKIEPDTQANPNLVAGGKYFVFHVLQNLSI